LQVSKRIRRGELDSRLIASWLLGYSGSLAVWDRVANRRRPLIVYYHNVHADGERPRWAREPSLSIPVGLFREQVEYLRRHYQIVSLDEAVTVKSSNVVAISFDDGYRGVYQQAFPILCAYRIPATTFLVTDHLGSASVLWWDELLYRRQVFRTLAHARQSAPTIGLPQPWITLLRDGSDPAEFLCRYKCASASVRHQVDAALASVQNEPVVHSERIFLSAAEIQEMQTAGMSFGAHTRTHRLLVWLDDIALLDELAGSMKAVEALTGRARCWLAYPDGIFGQREMAMAERLGFAGAVQTFRHPCINGQYAVPRLGLGGSVATAQNGRLSEAKMRWALAGLTKRRLWAALGVPDPAEAQTG
jgi:peptidoglycan/xylan/chitin deacetylase (PgdA/CDA1 family)